MLSSPPPLIDKLPRHVAVIMDDNGRWASMKGRPRTFGHRAGVRAARRLVQSAHRGGVACLTVFAFSQENWQRPESEVSLLMRLFLHTLAREIQALHESGARLRFLGDHSNFPPALRAEMARAVQLTQDNGGLQLNVAVGYSGQWDLVQAAARLTHEHKPVTAANLEAALNTAGLPPPDLLIRTGGESRISNFMLWQLAYTELYFCDTLWPDFDEAEFRKALLWYAGRERRYGRVAEAASVAERASPC
jgi:undecaprenyl diphosphate synthase